MMPAHIQQAPLPLVRHKVEAAIERTWIHIPAGMALRDVEQFYMRATLELHGGNRPKAAADLGISVKTLYNRLPVVSEGKAP